MTSCDTSLTSKRMTRERPKQGKLRTHFGLPSPARPNPGSMVTGVRVRFHARELQALLVSGLSVDGDK